MQCGVRGHWEASERGQGVRTLEISGTSNNVLACDRGVTSGRLLCHDGSGCLTMWRAAEWESGDVTLSNGPSCGLDSPNTSRMAR